MPSIQMTRKFVYTPAQLYTLAMDVENYPEFLPWCQSLRVFNRQKNTFDADMVIGYKSFREKVTTRVHFTENQRVRIEYLRGPMKHLKSDWTFAPDESGQGCVLQFDVDLELKNFVLNALLNGAFEKATSKLVQAFRDRAEAVYGAVSQ